MRYKVTITGYMDVPECWKDDPVHHADFCYNENDDLENAMTALCAFMREQYEDDVEIDFEIEGETDNDT